MSVPRVPRTTSSVASWSDAQVEMQARQLFEKNSVDQMRFIESNFRKDANEKKQELRKLVGNRYRDLIESADSIVDMKRSADGLVASISRMDEESAKLNRKGPGASSKSPQHAAKEAERAARKQKHTLAQDVKFLVDTPERIWGAMEHSQFWKASSLYGLTISAHLSSPRYLHAESVHRSLTKEKASQSLLSSAPLLARQWATLEHFPLRLKAAARARLQLPLLRPADYAGCLGALMLLDKLNLSKSFTEFLSSRKAGMRATFLKARGANVVWTTDTIKERLLTIAHTVAGTVCLIHSLYLASPSLLLSLLSAPELHATTKAVTVQLDLAPLPADSVQTAASQLIDTFADYIQKGGLKLLETVKTATELAALKAAVQAACNDPISTAGASAAPEGVTPQPWNEMCIAVLNKSVLLWPLFESVFLQRAKDIARLAFAGLSVRELLESSLKDLKNRTVEDHNIAGYMWREHGQDEKLEQAKLKANGVSPKTADAVAVIDGKLQAAITDLSALSTKDQADTQLQAHIQECCSEALLALASEVEAMLKELSRKIAAHPGPGATEEPDVSFYVDDSLFLGRVCRSIAEQSKQLPKIFPPTVIPLSLPSSEAVLKRSSSTSTSPVTQVARVRVATKTVENALLKQVQATFRKLYLSSHTLWAIWASKELSTMLNESLGQAEWLDPQRRRLWEDVTTAVPEGEEAPADAAKQRAPTMTSGYVTAFLFALVQELNRIGGHTVAKPVVQFLLQLLFPSVMECFTSLLANRKDPLSRDSSIQLCASLSLVTDLPAQLMFDVMFICEIFGSAKTPPLDAGDHDNLCASAASLAVISPQQKSVEPAKLKQLEEQLIAALTADLDPIDVAFYEPHLRKNMQRLYVRSSVLLGSLVQLHRLHRDSKTRAAVSEAHNVMPTCAPLQRFVTLPVSAAVADHKETPSQSFQVERQEDRSSLSMLTQMRRSLGLK